MATDVRTRLIDLAPELANWTPEWEAAQSFPVRFRCTVEEYLALDDNRLLEYADGFLEILPMPTIFHQLILGFLFRQLDDFTGAGNLGTVVLAGYRTQVGLDQYREPDLLFISNAHRSAIGENFCTKVDLAIEIVSESNRRHDLVTKRDEYARAGIREYWIVDPEEESITIFFLEPRKKSYSVHGVFRRGERATSRLLAGFSVDVAETLDQRP